MLSQIQRKTLLYKTNVEYGDYTINHVQGCFHGCLYPCYAYLIAKRFGRVKDYSEWIQPKIVSNAVDILNKEIDKYRDKIKFVHLCFTTDPFMNGFPQITEKSLEIIKILNISGIRCSTLTKGISPIDLCDFDISNEIGISLISLNERFREKMEPNTATYQDRISGLYALHTRGIKTWVSIEPYPTPNIIEQDIYEILESVNFVDKIIFGRLNYNKAVTEYLKKDKEYYNRLCDVVINYCNQHHINFHIKDGTFTRL